MRSNGGTGPAQRVDLPRTHSSYSIVRGLGGVGGLGRLAEHAHSGARGAENAEVLWRPAADARDTRRMGHYMTWLAENRGLVFDSYAELCEWPVTDLAGFWASVWHFFEVH